jgi:uncharacterized small protein (DUF1192 family)
MSSGGYSRSRRRRCWDREWEDVERRGKRRRSSGWRGRSGLRMGVDKVNGRVVGVRRKIVALEAEEEEKKGGRRAATMVDEGEGDDGKREGMDVDAETNGSSYYLA